MKREEKYGTQGALLVRYAARLGCCTVMTMNMRIFKMQGRQISSASLFIKWFSAVDFLLNRELAAGFVCQHMRNLGDWQNRYHCEVLYHALFNQSNFSGGKPKSAADYFAAYAPKQAMKYSDPCVPIAYTPTGPQAELLCRLWELAQKTDLSDSEKYQLFYLLGAGYQLAKKTPDEISLTPQEAQNAFRRISVHEDTAAWVSFPEEGDIPPLPARKEPYRILLRPDDARDSLKEKPILPRKLCAIPHRQGSTDIPVILELYRSPDDPSPRRAEFFPGDYRYCNFVGGVPVCLHPTEVQNGDCRMSRKGNELILTLGNGTAKVINCQEREIVSFAPEVNGSGYLLVDAKGIDYSCYSFGNMHRAILSRPGRVVEVAMRGSEFLLLFDKGNIVSNYINADATEKLSLSDLAG